MSKCYEAYEQLSDLGWQVGVAGLKDAIGILSDSWRSGEEVAESWREAKNVLCYQIEDFVKRRLADDDDPRNNCPKIKKLIEVLTAYEPYNSEDLRIIVFVRMRSTAKQLLELLEEVPVIKFLKKGILVGHGDSSNEKGMKTTKQVQVAKDFREGAINCLIATSVAEEGFDIAACNVVIRFDAMDNVTAFVQSRGRARKAESDFVVIYRDKYGELNLEQIKEQEYHMLQAVKEIMTGSIQFEAHLSVLQQAGKRHFIEEDCPKILHEWSQKHFLGDTHEVEMIPHRSRNPKAPVRWSANIHFPPPPSPSEGQIPSVTGGMRKTEALAKRAAAYDACTWLHTMGLLAKHIGNDFLLVKHRVAVEGVTTDKVIHERPSSTPIVLAPGQTSADAFCVLTSRKEDPASRRVVFRNFPRDSTSAEVEKVLLGWLRIHSPSGLERRIEKLAMHDMVPSRDPSGPSKAKAADVLFFDADDADVMTNDFYGFSVRGNSIKPEPYSVSEINPGYIEDQHKQMTEFDKKFEFADSDGFIIRPNVAYEADTKSRVRGGRASTSNPSKTALTSEIPFGTCAFPSNATLVVDFTTGARTPSAAAPTSSTAIRPRDAPYVPSAKVAAPLPRADAAMPIPWLGGTKSSATSNGSVSSQHAASRKNLQNSFDSKSRIRAPQVPVALPIPTSASAGFSSLPALSKWNPSEFQSSRTGVVEYTYSVQAKPPPMVKVPPTSEVPDNNNHTAPREVSRSDSPPSSRRPSSSLFSSKQPSNELSSGKPRSPRRRWGAVSPQPRERELRRERKFRQEREPTQQREDGREQKRAHYRSFSSGDSDTSSSPDSLHMYVIPKFEIVC